VCAGDSGRQASSLRISSLTRPLCAAEKRPACLGMQEDGQAGGRKDGKKKEDHVLSYYLPLSLQDCRLAACG